MRPLRNLLFAGIWALSFAAPAAPTPEAVLDVDSAKREMRLLRGDKVLATFKGVSVGRWGVSEQRKRGDGKTPLGEYRIAWIKPKGEFGPFMGFDYPSIARAEQGLADGEISEAEFNAIQKAHAEGRVPPQNTALGGYVGIHGLGRADPGIHRDINWTRGCVALTNAQMSQLMKLVGKGTLVRVH